MKKIFLIATVLAMTLWSCDKFDVSNENPDVALNINQNPELLLTNLQRRSIREAVSGSWSEGNLMGQYGARIVFTSFDLFDWGDQSGAWNNYYYTIRDAKELEKLASETDLNSYVAVSKIMQTWAFSILTDMWGDVPYSEVNQASEENYTPMYDEQEAIYTSMLSELAAANTLLSGSNLTQIKGDLLFDGDVDMWRKFANSLRMRLALRLSEVSPSVASGVISEIYGNPGQFPIMESNGDNAALTFLAANPDAHPVTEESVYRVGSYNEYRISEHFVTMLKDLNDPRLEFFADPTANSVEEESPKIVGMLNGVVDGPAYTYQGGDAFLSKFNIDYFYFQPNTNQARLMLYSEVQFILAEAAQKGWINADAQTFYEEGVTANFEYWGVELPTDYLTSAGVAFDNSLETIMTQKYINLFYTDYQGFIEYKRTGFPSTIEPGPDAFYDVYPSRFEYPSNEESLNNANYSEASNRIGGDQITTKVWWEN